MSALDNRTIVVTRAAAQAGELEVGLRAEGADVIAFPTIEIVDAADGGSELRGALANLDKYDWLVFTSANAVERTFLELMGVALEQDVMSKSDLRVAAIGNATARAVVERGVAVDVVPEKSVAEELLAAMLANPGGKRVLMPRAAIARDVLPMGLQAAGFEVDLVEAYRTVQGSPSDDAFAALPSADAVIFTSPSTVRGFLALAPNRTDLLAACIGPVTLAAAEKAGFTSRIESADASAVSLIKALVDKLGGYVP